jgi:hypothetical protein
MARRRIDILNVVSSWGFDNWLPALSDRRMGGSDPVIFVGVIVDFPVRVT